MAIAAAIAGAAAGAGLGALLAATIARHHSARVQEQLKLGGFVLWVSVSHPDPGKRAVAILNRMGAHDVHVHEIQREWSLREIPFAETQPDPFLENDTQAANRHRAPMLTGVVPAHTWNQRHDTPGSVSRITQRELRSRDRAPLYLRREPGGV